MEKLLIIALRDVGRDVNDHLSHDQIAAVQIHRIAEGKIADDCDGYQYEKPLHRSLPRRSWRGVGVVAEKDSAGVGIRVDFVCESERHMALRTWHNEARIALKVILSGTTEASIDDSAGGRPRLHRGLANQRHR